MKRSLSPVPARPVTVPLMATGGGGAGARERTASTAASGERENQAQ